MSNALITADTISFRYERESLIRDLNVEINSTDKILLSGANGAGKSTLLKLLAGILYPDSGNVNYQIKQSEIIYLGHNLQFYLDLSVADNCAFFSKLYQNEESQMSLADCWGFSQSTLRQKAGELSRGQQRKLSLALALSKPAKLVFLDEPFANLDHQHTELLQEKLISLEASLLFTSHIKKDVAEIFNRNLILEGGQLHA